MNKVNRLDSHRRKTEVDVVKFLCSGKWLDVMREG